MSHVTVIERAFTLARSGIYKATADVERKMIEEGSLLRGQLDGAALRKQIAALCKEARGEPVQKPARKSSKIRRVRPSLFS